MRTLHVFITLPVGGAEDLVLSLIRNADPENPVEVACLRDLGVAGEEAVRDGLPVHDLRLLTSKRTNLVALWRLARWIKTQGFDLVHSHVYNAHVYAVPAARLAGVPAILHHHKTFQPFRFRRWILMRLLSRLAQAQIALSAQTRADLIQSLRAPSHSFFVLSNAVDSQIYRPAEDRAQTRRSLGLPAEGTLLGAVASLTAPKNHSATLQALAAIPRPNSGIHCLICGEGGLRPGLESEIDGLGLGSVVRLVGNQRPIVTWLQAFDFLLLPSLWEGQPMILLQALSCGVPILASRIEGNVAVLGEDHPGLFNLESPDAYASALHRAVSDPAYRQQILDYQSLRREELWTLSSYVKRLADVYQGCF